MRALPVLALLLAACTQRDAGTSGSASLVSTVKASLAERERQVVSYRYDGVTEQGAQRADFGFAYRAPGKMRAELKSSGMTFLFDGKRFAQYDANRKVFTEIDLSTAPKDKASLFLHGVFAPFAPDGWRAPLLAGQLTAERRSEGGKELVVVTAVAQADEGAVGMTFRFAGPAMDFAGKSAQGGGEVKVAQQHCDEKLKLCFPLKVEESAPGAPLATTTLSHVEINGPIPPETFDVEAPGGAQREVRHLE